MQPGNRLHEIPLESASFGVEQSFEQDRAEVPFAGVGEDDHDGLAGVLRSLGYSNGGGFMFLSYAHEGTQVCEWLNSVGVSAVLLKC